MKAFTVATVLLSLALSAVADDATALQGLQTCVQNANAASNLAYLSGWGLSTATTGRKLKQTAQNCADLEALAGNAVPCTATASTPTTPTTPTYGTPPTATTSAPSTSTTSTSSPCGSSSNPVPWTGLLCTNGAVTSVIMSQLGPNVFGGNCSLDTLGGLAGLASLQTLDFTDVGLTGSIPANWSTGAWSSTLQSITLAQNPDVTGSIANFSGLTALTSINVASSGFTGSIPLSAQGYPALLSFVATDNDLTGPLPSSLPANLTTLNVGVNQLNGTLPSYNSTSLSTFQVNNNTLSGCLPSAWTTGLTNLTTVDLSYNDLSGSIPSTWQASGAFPDLQTIDLVGNNFCGSTGSLGTPVGTVGQNNPSATRLVPSVSFAACSGTESC